ncbi:MAG: 4Fe-4S dicluster domain-containing protein [Actinobacteria bacterium]|nr:4Fe-4S dicluster domain-containing protein [Actinomycetota bacterium]MBU4219820.1 4Fe-4S dicluster domain-containing protein [Actinomycetota bacterium]MBU4358904.1 4Fe-4S dicluster domain-containing protein [Actinomycetota bacterium]MBU4392742.1 4Fe-4S dicluster domain-containing protein [Actinomycetota bacterium]MBU4403357.1 4Fe-4S dicluster domain-containing protein [Actinomycetota bacterium]
MFIKDKCDLCGECFERCPESEFSLEKAKIEIEKLVKGAEGAGILSKCSSCFACNLYRKENVRPYVPHVSSFNCPWTILFRAVLPREAGCSQGGSLCRSGDR